MTINGQRARSEERGARLKEQGARCRIQEAKIRRRGEGSGKR